MTSVDTFLRLFGFGCLPLTYSIRDAISELNELDTVLILLPTRLQSEDEA